MSIIPKSWTGVDELRDQMWKLQQKVDLLETVLIAYAQQPRPVSVDPAGKIGQSTLPSPERALDAAAVLADAIAKHDLKIHEAECIAREKPTDWWSRVKIFEVVKR